MSKIVDYITEDWANGPITFPLVQCDCGGKVYCCNSWSNECDCGAEYNRGGQRLADRRYWGEETGETF